MLLNADPRVQAWQTRAGRYPTWVWKGTAILTSPIWALALITIALTLIVALFFVALTFGILSTIALVLDPLPKPGRHTAASGSEGRENVRVLDR